VLGEYRPGQEKEKRWEQRKLKPNPQSGEVVKVAEKKNSQEPNQKQ
jgi:hypothetical protein